MNIECQDNFQMDSDKTYSKSQELAPISPELEMSHKIIGILGGRESETYKALNSS